MSKTRPEDDPLYRSLKAELEKATRNHRRALREMRRLYLSNEVPDKVQAALYQQISHETGLKLAEAEQAFSKFCWELSPLSNSPVDLEVARQKRTESIERSIAARINAAPTFTDHRGRKHLLKDY